MTQPTTATTATTATTNDLATASANLRAIREELNARYIECADRIDIITYCLITGHHGLQLGLKGEAKSALIDAMVARLVGADTMKLLLNGSSTLDEEFGPLDPSQLLHGVFHRAVDGYAPASHVVILGEVFKAGSMFLNGNLGLMNEREYRNDGRMRTAPLISLFGDSNEMPPENTGESLDALFDRFLLRTWITPLSRAGRRQLVADEMLRRPQRASGVDTSGKTGTTLTLAQLDTLRVAALRVTLPDDVRDAYWRIEDALEAEGYPMPSPRRLVWLWDAVAASATLHGRTTATVADLIPLQYALWEKPEHIAAIRLIVMQIAAPMLAKARDVYDRLVGDVNETLADVQAAVKAGTREADAKLDARLAKTNQALRKGADELLAMYQQAKGAGLADIADAIRDMGRDVRAKGEQIKHIATETMPAFD